MKIVDAHFHLWDIENNPYPWLVDPVEHFAGDYKSVRRNYLIDDFRKEAEGGPYELSKSVHVQAGWDKRLRVSKVTCVDESSSRLAIQILLLPSISLTKTNSRPLGLNRGCLSKAGPVRNGFACPPEAGSR